MLPVVVKDGVLVACTASDGKVAVRSDLVSQLVVVEPAAISDGVYSAPSYRFKAAAPAKPQQPAQRKVKRKGAVANG